MFITGVTLFWLAIKSTILLAAAALLDTALLRASAAVRHLIWAVALAGLLLLPFLGLALPGWEAPAPAAVAVAMPSPGATVVDVTAGRGGFRFSGAGMIWGLWAAGFGFVALRMIRGMAQVARVWRSARPWPAWGPDVLLGGGIALPVVCGFRRPRIVLPAEAAGWPASRLRVALMHERMHIARHDTRAHLLAQLVCALYWPSPLVWYAASRLRREAEKACDDGVLAQGEAPAEYAGELVEIVQDLRHAGGLLEGGLAMGRVSDLEGRVKAMLKPGANRRQASRLVVAAACGLALLILLPLASVQAPAQQPGVIAGVVRDATGAVTPGARITVTLAGTDRKEFAVANQAGEFRLGPVPEGTYNLTVASPGFALFRTDGIQVKGGATANVQVVLNIGQAVERIEVRPEAPAPGVGITPPAPSAPQAPATPGPDAMRIRVGGNVQSAKLLSMVRPVYPPDCKAAGIEGTVALRATIGTDGSVLDLQQVNQLVDPRLVAAAREAVQQWRYAPTLLNGRPVEILTEITVNFSLAP